MSWYALLRAAHSYWRWAVLAFFGIEHQTAMLMATAVAHIGMDRAKRATAGPARHRVMRTTMIVLFAFVLVGIPWPWRPYGRPLFRTTW